MVLAIVDKCQGVMTLVYFDFTMTMRSTVTERNSRDVMRHGDLANIRPTSLPLSSRAPSTHPPTHTSWKQHRMPIASVGLVSVRTPVVIAL
eukprot:scaffold1591_cov130-Skeletonema_menzelii.AAC.5